MLCCREHFLSVQCTKCRGKPSVYNILELQDEVWSHVVVRSDSVAVFKSREAKVIPLLPGFLFFLCSLTRCLAPAPLKLRPYGAIQICLLLLLFFDPGTQFPGNEKITLCNTKSTKIKLEWTLLLLLLLLLNNCVLCLPSVLWRWWLGGRKGIRPVKNWVVGCWHGYLTEARCRFAYGPADATATHCLLLQ